MAEGLQAIETLDTCRKENARLHEQAAAQDRQVIDLRDAVDIAKGNTAVAKIALQTATWKLGQSERKYKRLTRALYIGSSLLAGFIGYKTLK